MFVDLNLFPFWLVKQRFYICSVGIVRGKYLAWMMQNLRSSIEKPIPLFQDLI